MAITPPPPLPSNKSSWGVGGVGWFMNPPTISGASVGLPPNTIYIDPNSGRVFRTV